VPPPIPIVEAADNRNAPGVRCPNGETHALNTVDFHRLRAEYAAELAMVALGEQIQIHFAELWPEAEWVFGHLLATGPANPQQIGLRVGQPCEKEAGHLPLLHRRQHTTTGAFQHLDAERVGQVGPYHQAVPVRVRTENRKGITVFGTHQRVYIGIAGQ